MICTPFRGPDGVLVIACSHGRRGHPRCEVCGGDGGDWLCDGPSRRPSGKGTCDRKLCAKCRRSIDLERDLCPEHHHHRQGDLDLRP